VNVLNLGVKKIKIIEAIVDIYISTGAEVNSEILCELLDFSISFAELHSEVLELTNWGLLVKSRTSFSVTPTHFGYQIYINRIMDQKMTQPENNNLADGMLFYLIQEPLDLIQNAVEISPKYTYYTTVFTQLVNGNSKIKNIWLLLVEQNLVMVVLMTSLGVIKHKLIRCDYEFSAQLLAIFQKILQKRFLNVEIVNVTSIFIKAIITSLNREILPFILPFVKSIAELAKEASCNDVTFV
jgi:heat-inducible transcriptional repressor